MANADDWMTMCAFIFIFFNSIFVVRGGATAMRIIRTLVWVFENFILCSSILLCMLVCVILRSLDEPKTTKKLPGHCINNET